MTTKTTAALTALAALLIGLAACGGTDDAPRDAVAEAAPTYDAVPPTITEFMPQPAVLVFSKTRGWRHDEGISGADLFFVRLAREKGWGAYTTENGAVFTPDILDRFDIVVFNNVTGDVLSDTQQAAFAAWVEAGGGFLGLHGSGDASSQDWTWYREELIGPDYMNHPYDPQFQEARVEVLTPGHPVVRGLPPQWRQSEEWYSFYASATEHGFTPLVGLDETTYAARNEHWEPGPDLSMGQTPAEHPIIWAGCPGGGRSVYSAIGHLDTAYEVETYAQLLRNAFDWLAQETDPMGTAC